MNIKLPVAYIKGECSALTLKSKSFQAGTITSGLALEINEKRGRSRRKPKDKVKYCGGVLTYMWDGASSGSGACEVGNLRCNLEWEGLSFLPPSLSDVNPLKP